MDHEENLDEWFRKEPMKQAQESGHWQPDDFATREQTPFGSWLNDVLQQKQGYNAVLSPPKPVLNLMHSAEMNATPTNYDFAQDITSAQRNLYAAGFTGQKPPRSGGANNQNKKRIKPVKGSPIMKG